MYFSQISFFLLVFTDILIIVMFFLIFNVFSCFCRCFSEFVSFFVDFVVFSVMFLNFFRILCFLNIFRNPSIFAPKKMVYHVSGPSFCNQPGCNKSVQGPEIGLRFWARLQA